MKRDNVHFATTTQLHLKKVVYMVFIVVIV